MAIRRSELIDNETPGFYHLSSRCAITVIILKIYNLIPINLKLIIKRINLTQLIIIFYGSACLCLLLHICLTFFKFKNIALGAIVNKGYINENI